MVFTGDNLQLVLMSLNPNEEIGEEVHKDVDQFFRVEEGSGKLVTDGEETPLPKGSSLVVVAGTNHNVIASEQGMKLYTVYAPPQHPVGLEQKSRSVKD